MSGDDSNNNWLDSTPTRGNASAFVPGGSGIDVSPDGVKLFSTQATGEANDFRVSSQQGVQSLMGQASQIGASFMEADGFGVQHSAGLEAMMMFTGDAGIGLMALGQGAQTIAINYINGDATSAATMKDVESAFDVAGGNGLRTTPNGAGTAPQTGQGNSSALPPPSTAGNTPNYAPHDPHADQTITQGDGSYTVPGDAPNDLERIDPQDIRNTDMQFRDDLAKLEG